MRKLLILCVLAALVAAGCSSGSESSDASTTTQPGASGDAETNQQSTTTAADTTTTAGETTTTVAATADLDSCVVGTWLMDSAEFFAQVIAAEGSGDVENFEFLGGEYSMTVGADGAFTVVRDEWSFGLESDQGDLRVVISAEDAGTYTLEGNVLTTTVVTDPNPEIDVYIDDVLFDFPGDQLPIEPPQAEFTGATVTCDGDVMTAGAGGPFVSTWVRVG